MINVKWKKAECLLIWLQLDTIILYTDKNRKRKMITFDMWRCWGYVIFFIQTFPSVCLKHFYNWSNQENICIGKESIINFIGMFSGLWETLATVSYEFLNPFIPFVSKQWTRASTETGTILGVRDAKIKMWRLCLRRSQPCQRHIKINMVVPVTGAIRRQLWLGALSGQRRDWLLETKESGKASQERWLSSWVAEDK